MHFFVTDAKREKPYPPIPFRTIIQEERKQLGTASEKHFDILSRILYIYGRLNIGIQYVQGMNELLAPFYYVFTADNNEHCKDTIDSDSFFCFTILMRDAKDGFIKQLDNSDSGINSRIKTLNM